MLLIAYNMRFFIFYGSGSRMTFYFIATSTSCIVLVASDVMVSMANILPDEKLPKFRQTI